MRNGQAYSIVSEMVTALKRNFPFTLRPEEGYIIDASMPGFVDLTLYAIAPIGFSEMQAIVDLIGRVQTAPHTRFTPEGEYIKIEVEFCVPLMRRKPHFK